MQQAYEKAGLIEGHVGLVDFGCQSTYTIMMLYQGQLVFTSCLTVVPADKIRAKLGALPYVIAESDLLELENPQNVFFVIGRLAISNYKILRALGRELGSAASLLAQSLPYCLTAILSENWKECSIILMGTLVPFQIKRYDHMMIPFKMVSKHMLHKNCGGIKFVSGECLYKAQWGDFLGG